MDKSKELVKQYLKRTKKNYSDDQFTEKDNNLSRRKHNERDGET